MNKPTSYYPQILLAYFGINHPEFISRGIYLHQARNYQVEFLMQGVLLLSKDASIGGTARNMLHNILRVLVETSGEHSLRPQVFSYRGFIRWRFQDRKGTECILSLKGSDWTIRLEKRTEVLEHEH
ncbi:hypothetical protein VTL71DRAFT_5507 [Oculimacula yallundae]|uniref:Uncharacterized protein n=1 Tax=Oculimacula yallundae TaxID=86028 RepID=A0ABR4C1Z5_9HELO